MSVTEPSKILTPWAASGLKNAIPDASDPVTGKAGYDQGFPAINMTAKEAGGIPPFGQDFNGIFFDVTKILQYMQAGGHPTYSATLSTSIGGYPLGAMLAKSSGLGFWRNTTANNVTNPDAGGAGWVSDSVGNYANATVVTAASTSLAVTQAGQAFLFTTPSSTVALPPATGVAAGGVFKLHTSAGATLLVTGGGVMQVGESLQTSLAMVAGTEVAAISTGTTWWVFGTAVIEVPALTSTCLVNATGTGAPHETVVAALPATVGPSTRLVLPNPFGVNTPVTVLVEAFLNERWGATGFAFTNSGLGIGGGYSQGEGIIVQSSVFTATNSISTGGTHGWTGGNIATPLKVRVFVTKKDQSS